MQAGGRSTCGQRRGAPSEPLRSEGKLHSMSRRVYARMVTRTPSVCAPADAAARDGGPLTALPHSHRLVGDGAQMRLIGSSGMDRSRIQVLLIGREGARQCLAAVIEERLEREDARHRRRVAREKLPGGRSKQADVLHLRSSRDG